MRIENTLQTQVNLVAVRQQFVEFLLAEHRAQGSLRELRSLIDVIGDFHHRLIGIDHAQENNRVDFQRDVVAGDDVLRRNFQRFLPQRNAHHAVDRAEHQNDARALGLAQQAPEPEDDAALIFSQDLDGTQQVDDKDDDSNGNYRKPEIHICLQATRNSEYERIVAQASECGL